jgi:copper chaperone
MLEFMVQDMTCGHCAGRVTKAVKSIEPQASVDIDLDRRVVKVSGASNTQEVEAAIREAGYTPERKIGT